MSRDDFSERTKIQLTISSWYHVMVIVGAMAAIYFGLRYDVKDSIRIGTENAQTIRQLGADVNDLKYGFIRQEDDLKNFHNTYERDFNKYIREPYDRTDRR